MTIVDHTIVDNNLNFANAIRVFAKIFFQLCVILKCYVSFLNGKKSALFNKS